MTTNRKVSIRTRKRLRPMSVLFWTERHVFYLTANAMLPVRGIRMTKANKRGYLGLTYSNRMPEVGEEHHRGGDLYDGDFSEKTWKLIVRDLMRHAFLQTASTIKHVARRKRRTTKAKVKRS